MAYRNVYKTQEEFNIIQEWGTHYEGFVVGLGYTWMKDRVIVPPNQNGWNPIPEYVPQNQTFHQIVSERGYDTSQYAYERSLMQDETKAAERIIDLIVRNKGNNITEVNLGKSKQYLPTDNSNIKVAINDTGSKCEVHITATDKSNGNTYMQTYDSLTEFLSDVRDSNNVPEINRGELNPERVAGLNLEGAAGAGFGIAENAGKWAERVMNNRGAYLPKGARFGSRALPPIIRSPLGSYEVPVKVMKGLRNTGRVLGTAGVVLTLYQIGRDVTNGRKTVAAARAGVMSVTYGVTFIPYVGWALAIGIGVADFVWGDEFYEWVDEQASELDIWWNGVNFSL